MNARTEIERVRGPIFPGNYPFSNNLMFNRVMEDESICRRLLECVLHIDIARVEHHQTQMEIAGDIYSKSVRLDVYVKGRDAVYDIEMQAAKEPYLARRYRYYQAKMDSRLLSKGDGYGDLVDSFVIFICTDDPFGRDIPVYTVRHRCEESASLDIKSGTTWIALNAAAWKSESNRELRDLLEYVHDGTVSDKDGLVRDISDAVYEANHDEGWVSEMWSVNTVEENWKLRMRYTAREAYERGYEQAYEQIHDQVHAEGFAEGETRYNALVAKLADEGRLEELAAASKNPALLQALFAELL